MFELRSKISKDKLEIDTATMSLFKTIMFHAKVPGGIIDRFSSSRGDVIGENLGKDIAKKLDEALVILMAGVLVERKVIVNGKLLMKIAPVDLGDMVYLKAFSLFCKNSSPFEIR